MKSLEFLRNTNLILASKKGKAEIRDFSWQESKDSRKIPLFFYYTKPHKHLLMGFCVIARGGFEPSTPRV